jgi:hypothetical protein
MSLLENDYLDKLLIEVEKIADVDSVYVTPSGTYEVVYSDIIPGLEEIEQINTILLNWPQNKHRYDLILSINEDYETSLQNGFVVPSSLLSSDPTGGWKLPVDTESVSILNLQLVLAQINNTENINITDSAGNVRSLPLSDLQTLMTPYSAAATAVRQDRAQSIYTINQSYNSYDGGGDVSDINP